MLVDNYYKVLLANYCNNVTIEAKLPSGSMYPINKWDGLKLNSLEAKIIFGTGRIPASQQDYYLKGDKIENIEIQNITYLYDLLDDGVKITKLINIYNTGSETVNIGEMIWMADLHVFIGDGDDGMVDRTVFDQPITLAPGKTEQINYSIYFKYEN